MDDLHAVLSIPAIPTTYYGEQSGVGLVLRHHRPENPKRVGLVGLGAGTLAAYGKSGDSFRFYEINPDVVQLAKRHFTYLAECPADVKIILGDARISMEHELPQRYDVLVLDAFSGDAVPTHLLTRESGEIYLKHLRKDGILAVHISNRHLDLRPVLAGFADHFALSMILVESKRNSKLGTSPSLWALLSQEPSSVEVEAFQPGLVPLPKRRLLWTDTHSDLFRILRIRFSL